MTTKHPRALIIGGSMAGLFCGAHLRKAGWQVDIYERAGEALASRGAGIATHPGLYAAMQVAGIPLRPEMGVASEGRLVFAPDGTLLDQCDMPQLMTSWGFIYRHLRGQFPDSAYHNGYTLAAIEQHDQGVTARFANGETATGDWLIGADGTRSTVRGLVAPGVESRYCGYFGWRGLADEAALGSDLRALLCHRFALNPAAHGHLLGYMVAGPGEDLRPGHRWYNWIWYRRADAAALRDHHTGIDGVHYPHGIPHDLIRPALIDAMHREATNELAPCLRAVVRATSRPFLQGIHEVAVARMRHGRVALIGDAAFTARPHVGLGVSKAADDATQLALALSAKDQESALGAWETARLRYGNAALRWGQALGSYIEAPMDDPAHTALAAHHRRPDVLMAQTAANDPERYLELA